MSDDGSEQNTPMLSLPAFHFRATIGMEDALQGIFREVDGLEFEPQITASQQETSQAGETNGPPGLTRAGSVTLKRGVFKASNAFWSWYAQVEQNTIQRQNVVIVLLDQDGAATMQWTLTNAWATKITGAELKANGNEIAVQCIELAFETIIPADG